MIHRLSIHGYKSLQAVELDLAQRLIAFLGPNGSGKSNLFDALDLLRQIVCCTTLEEAFRKHRGDPIEAFTQKPYEGLIPLTEQTLRMGFEVDVELSESTVQATEEEIARYLAEPGVDPNADGPRISEQFLRYRIELEYLSDTGVLRVLDEELAALRRDGLPKESRTSFLSRAEDGGKRVIRLRLEGRGGHPEEYDVGLPYAVISRPHHPPHYPHIDAFKRELDHWCIYHLDPHALSNEAEARFTTRLGRGGENLAAFLGTLQEKEPAWFQQLERMLHLLIPSCRGLRIERTPRGPVRLYLVDDGVKLSAQSLSEGTLLVIGLLAALQPSPYSSLVALAEPENGLHPVRIGTVARLLSTAAEAGEAQVLVNTHSPLLARCLPESSLLVCRRGPQGTRIEPFHSSGEVMRSVEIQEALNPGDEPDLSGDQLQPFFKSY
ncbi:MAG: AAA family ATPase [Bradymonadales bacterium]|nr:AAA family ATPase [Bradymonadales bacterium]